MIESRALKSTFATQCVTMSEFCQVSGRSFFPQKPVSMHTVREMFKIERKKRGHHEKR